MFSQEISTLATRIVSTASDKGLSVTTVESCTGGLIAGAITEASGSSAIFNRGFVTYSNESKTDLVGVPCELLEKHGAVSSEVAEAMAEGARHAAKADVAISATGIAGPSGGTAEKPVGLGWFGRSTSEGTESWSQVFDDRGRSEVRQAAVQYALQRILESLS
jgi:nicotinamide-nucleotide amidase